MYRAFLGRQLSRIGDPAYINLHLSHHGSPTQNAARFSQRLKSSKWEGFCSFKSICSRSSQVPAPSVVHPPRAHHALALIQGLFRAPYSPPEVLAPSFTLCSVACRRDLALGLAMSDVDAVQTYIGTRRTRQPNESLEATDQRCTPC